MANRWKPGQLKAIDWRKGELIVSASAGTGKTSVIIERAWQIVQSRQANVDELMIVTFTEDAAEQLKSRFLDRLDAEITQASQPEKRAFLRDQFHRLDRAQISTIHSLCLRIIRENYHLLGISDEISVLPPEQAELLKHRLMDGILEESYAAGNEFGTRFRTLIEKYGGSVDANIARTVLGLHAFLNSLAWPNQWRDRARALAAEYREETFDLAGLPAWIFLKEQWLGLLEEASAEFQQLRGEVTVHNYEAVNTYLESLAELAREWSRVIESGDTEAISAAMNTSLPRSPSIKKEEIKIWWTPVKNRIDAIKENMKQLAGECGEAVTPGIAETLRKQAELIDTILDLEETLGRRLERAKADEGQLEFDDLQRLALKVLTRQNANGGESVSAGAVAERYRELFRFVMVDEYQDINELQDTIIRLLCKPSPDNAERCDNLFMVGDVKQSIYRFRQAEPEIFQQLYRLAGEGQGLDRIDLPDNFRSRREVLDAVNAVFTPLLGGGELELTYDEGSQLVCGASYPETQRKQATELHILERKIEAGEEDESGEGSDMAEMEALSREAYLAARKIRDLVDSKFPVFAGGELRPIEPEDIVILLRSLRNTAGTYISMLRRMGLNAYCQQMEAFLEYPEIADIVSLLKIIDNPFHDIPLATVLRSPFVGASIDELAEIRLAAGKGPFYQGLLQFTADNPLHPAGRKFQHFLDRYTRWRRTAGCCSVAELVQQIYLETHYPDYIRAGMPELAGAENLDQFLELAWQFSSDGRSDLRDFLDYLDMLAERSAPISSVQAGAGTGVRLMTVHASKGLEFPVVVLGNLGKKINLMDIRRDILIDRHLLLGMKEVEPLGLSKEDTLPFLAIAKRIRNQSVAEEIRLLYVAMTRAKEKLIMVGSGRADTLANSLVSIIPESDGRVSPRTAAKRDTPLGWVSTALAASEDGKNAMLNLLGSEHEAADSCGPIDVAFYPASAQTKWVAEHAARRPARRESARELLAKIDERPTALSPEAEGKIETILNVLDWRYPHEMLCTTPTHFSVTELTQRADAFTALNVAEGDQLALPRTLIGGGISFPNEKGREALERGTAWHKVLEKIDLAGPLDEADLKLQIETLVAGHSLTADQARMVDPHKIERFFVSPPGRLMLDHRETLYRELPFTFLLAAKDFPAKMRPVAADEPILIQGVIDCLVRTEAGLVIIDYKTNSITAGEVDRMTDHYRTQIELYARAMGEILQERVASAWLYFSEPDSAVQVM